MFFWCYCNSNVFEIYAMSYTNSTGIKLHSKKKRSNPSYLRAYAYQGENHHPMNKSHSVFFFLMLFFSVVSCTPGLLLISWKELFENCFTFYVYPFFNTFLVCVDWNTYMWPRPLQPIIGRARTATCRQGCVQFAPTFAMFVLNDTFPPKRCTGTFLFAPVWWVWWGVAWSKWVWPSEIAKTRAAHLVVIVFTITTFFIWPCSTVPFQFN